MSVNYIRIKQLTSNGEKQGLLPIRKSTLYRWIKEGRFPKPIKLGPCVSAWALQDVLEWVREKESQQ